MRHAYGNANGDAHIHTDGDCDSNCYSNGNCDRTAAVYPDTTPSADTAAAPLALLRY